MNTLKTICNLFDQIHIALNRQMNDPAKYELYKTFIDARLDRIEELEKGLKNEM